MLVGPHVTKTNAEEQHMSTHTQFDLSAPFNLDFKTLF